MLPTMVVCGILLSVLVAVIAGMVRNKKKGKSFCGCRCEDCAMNGRCH